jgi:DMSO/TMAO reductase YedYZ heme-binding membrane subunit
MNSGNITAFVFICALFGIMGCAAVFLNAYEGYSRLTALSKRKKFIMSAEYAALAFVILMLAAAVILFLCYKGVMLV